MEDCSHAAIPKKPVPCVFWLVCFFGSLPVELTAQRLWSLPNHGNAYNKNMELGIVGKRPVCFNRADALVAY